MGTYVFSKTLHFLLGARVGDDFGDTEATPVGGVYWKASDKLLVRAVFPRPKVSYAVSENFNAFVAGEPTGGEWSVKDKDYKVRLEGYRVGVGGEYQVIDGGWLFAMAGSDSQRELQLAKDDDRLLDGDADLDDAAFFQIGFRLR